MTRQFYLAARYTRRVELCGYRDTLIKLGFGVTGIFAGASPVVQVRVSPCPHAGVSHHGGEM